MPLTISLPDEILLKAEELAARGADSLQELVVAALSEQLAGVSICACGVNGPASKGSERRSIRFPITVNTRPLSCRPYDRKAATCSHKTYDTQHGGDS